MSRKKKAMPKGNPRWWQLSTYNKLGLLRRNEFFIYANTPAQATQKLKRKHKDANVLCISPLI